MLGRSTRRNPGCPLMTALIVATCALAAEGQSPGSAPGGPAGPAPRARAKATPAPPRARARQADDEPTVMSFEAAAAARGRPVARDRYGEPDWREVPPWRQTSFFGIRAQGQVFIYVVDCSGSMIDEDRLDRAKRELRRSVAALQSPQRFKVIFYNDRPIPMPGDLPRAADHPSKAQLGRWLDLVQPDGGTDPRGALSLALAMRPDAVFLLSDGAFPDGTAEAVAHLNPGKVPIHCIDLANGAAGDDLRKIAAGSGGQYAPRSR